MPDQPKTEWEATSLREHGRVLTGLKSHYCWDWDGLTVDETTIEFEACSCFSDDPSSLPPRAKPVQ